MKKSVFGVPKMDCASEERLVRMALEPLDQGRSRHSPQAARPPNFGARLVETGEAGPGRANEAAVPVEERKTLRLLLAVNAAMFFVEIITGWLAESRGLIADSLDMSC